MLNQKFRKDVERRALKQLYSGVPIDSVSARFGLGKDRISQLSQDYRDGKIDIFGPGDDKRFRKMIREENDEIKALKRQVMELEHALKMANIKAEGLEIMLRIGREDYGIDLSKKAEAGQLTNSKRDTRK